MSEIDVVNVRLVRDYKYYSDKNITCPLDVVDLLGDVMAEFDRETLAVITLDNKNKPININFASVGAIDSSIVSPREILKVAILSNAKSIMLAHNHPSSDVTPSKYDVMVTDQMSKACKLMEIPLVDHVIIGRDNYFSFKSKSVIDYTDSFKYETDYKKIIL